MKFKQARQVMLGLLGAMAASLLLGALLASSSAAASLFFAVIGVILFFAFMAYSFSHWRCPHCDEFLGWNLGKGIQLCPYCYGRLDAKKH